MSSVLVLGSLFAASAQAPEARLRGSIREENRAVLEGSMPPRVAGAKDLGPVRADQRLEGITLVFRRSAAQEADLQQILAAQQDVSSPEFHRWLTPDAFGRRFGMADSDIQTTEGWLSGRGFTITGVSRARDRITFSGTAEQVANAFSATLHHFEVDGEVHVAPGGDLSMPADLAGVTAAVLHLSDFRPHPMMRRAAEPSYTTGSNQAHYLSPQDLAVMYDFPIYKVIDPGAGQTIAVVGQSYVDLSLNSVVRRFFTSSETLTLTPVLVPGTGVQAISPGDATESEIDLEYASSLLNSANILLVYVGSNPNYSVMDAVAFAIDENVAPVVSISYGECETLLSAAEVAQGNALFEQAAMQGQTLVAASGDAGPTACAPYPISPGFTATQQQALSVNYPADSPYVTAVGGTQMAANTFGPGPSPYWAVPSAYDDVQSLLSYVPETTWNEGTSTRGILAGGGGASGMITRPSWQAGVPGIPAGSTRLLPDISLQSSTANPGFLFCSDDLSFQRQYPSCGSQVIVTTNYALAGGTSFAAPTFAAMVALLNQNTQTLGQGNVNPILYGLAGDANTASSVFHDITSGSIACTAGVPGCSAAGETGFPATTGYDEATGLGSVDYLHLLAAWPTASHPATYPTVTTIQPLETAIQPGATDVVYVRVESVNETTQVNQPPSGGFAISVDGTAVVPNLAIATTSTVDYSGSATYTLTAPTTSGSHVIVATYAGDSTHGPSTSTAAIMVGNVVASGGVTLAVAPVTIPANGTGSTTVTVTPSGGYDGRLVWSLSLASTTNASLTGCYAIPSIAVQGVSTVTLKLGAGTACTSASSAGRLGLKPMDVRGAGKVAGVGSWGFLQVGSGVVICCLMPLARKRRLPALFCLTLILSGIGFSGCGGSGSSASSPGTGGTTVPPPVPQGTIYSATLSGQDSVNTAITASATFNLTVQ